MSMNWTYIEETKSLFGLLRNVLPADGKEEVRDWLTHNPNYKGSYQYDDFPIPRTQIWYQEEGHYFCPTWKGKFPRWEAVEYDSVLTSLQREIQCLVRDAVDDWNTSHAGKRVANPAFNSCLVNRYRGKGDSIHPHRDTADSFGYQPTIAGFSLGGARSLELFRTDSPGECVLSFPLPSNSLFLMAGDSQINYLHGIPKVPQEIDERFSLTFREWQG